MSNLMPHEEPIEVAGEALSADELITLLGPQLTEARREKIEGVVSERTYHVVTVLDGLYDRGNVSAVIRSAEALGYQEMHVLETQEHFKEANRVTQGTDKWLDIHKWEQPTPCISQLKERGYQIVATHLEAAEPIGEIDFSRPTAMVFGNERDGVSDEVLEASDARCIVPMVGFAQSYNISVSAALALYHIYEERVGEFGKQGDLNEDERRILKAMYYLKSVNKPERLVPALVERKL